MAAHDSYEVRTGDTVVQAACSRSGGPPYSVRRSYIPHTLYFTIFNNIVPIHDRCICGCVVHGGALEARRRQFEEQCSDSCCWAAIAAWRVRGRTRHAGGNAPRVKEERLADVAWLEPAHFSEDVAFRVYRGLGIACISSANSIELS